MSGEVGEGDNSLSFLINLPDKPLVTNFNLFNDNETWNKGNGRENNVFPSGGTEPTEKGSPGSESSFKLPLPDTRPRHNFSPPKPVFTYQQTQVREGMELTRNKFYDFCPILT